MEALAGLEPSFLLLLVFVRALI